MLIKSQQALNWVKAALDQIPPELRELRMGSADRPLAIVFIVYYKTRRPDLSVELIMDMLQEAGVISDDRHVYETHAYKNFDPANPGVEIFIEYQDDIEDVESEVFDGQRESRT
jgi:Holliday junction resolvase RusA-like endonuclease